MRVTWKTELPQWLLIAGMFLLAAISWDSAPDEIPVHWDLSGRADVYAGRLVGLLLLPLLALGMYFLLLIMPRLDPKRANYEYFSGAYLIVRTVIIVILAGLYLLVNLAAYGRQPDILLVVPILIGGLLIVAGSVMGKLRPNWFVGIRTPWTLSSRLSWRKTHRLGGWLFVAVGFVFVVAGVASSTTAFVLALILLIAVTVWLVVYSYLVWRGDPERSSHRDAYS